MYLLFICEAGFDFGFFFCKHILFLFEFVDTGLNFIDDLFGFIKILSGADKDVMDLFFLIVEFVGLTEVSLFWVFDNFGGVVLPDLR